MRYLTVLFLALAFGANAQLVVLDSLPDRFPFDFQGKIVFLGEETYQGGGVQWTLATSHRGDWQWTEVSYDPNSKAYEITASEKMTRPEIETMADNYRARTESRMKRDSARVERLKRFKSN